MNHLSAFIWHYLHSVKSMPDFLCHDPGTNLLPDSFCFWAKQKLTLRRFGCRLSSYCIFFCCGTCDCFLRIVSKHVALLCKSYRSNVSVCVFLTIQGLCWSSDVYTGCVCVCVSCNTFRFQSNVPLREMVALHLGSVYLVNVFQITLITTPFKCPVKPGKHLPFLRAHTKPYHDERGLFGVQFPAWGFDGRKRQMKYLFSVDPRSRPLKLVDVWKTWWLKKR